MIDFTHFADVGGKQPDEEYLCGIDNFRAHLEALLQGSVADAPGWLAGRLVPPPPPGPQDKEEVRTSRELHVERIRPGSCCSRSPQMEANLASNTQTVSGV